jgi:hypothetical protein
MTERWTDPGLDAVFRRELARATSDWHAEREWRRRPAARNQGTRVLSVLGAAVVTVVIVVGALLVHSRVGNSPQAALPPATTGVPLARSLAAAAYDPLTRQTVMFGGLPEGGSLGDTWTWDGERWLQQHPALSPHAREGALMAFDPALHGIVLLGGNPNGPTDAIIDSDIRATWLWDDRGWHRLDTAHTPVLNYYAFWHGQMAFDATSQRLLLVSENPVPHGGVCSMDTWTFDGRDWTRLSPATPLPAPVRVLVADGTGGVLALLNPRPALVSFGFVTSDCPAGSPAARALPAVSTWSWTGATWTQLPGQQPPPSDAAGDAGAALVDGHALLVTEQLGVWSWQGSGWQSVPAATKSPQPRTLAAVGADAHGQLVLFGGELQQPPSALGDTWTWGGATWAPRT